MAQELLSGLSDVSDAIEDFVDELKPGTRLLHGQYTILRYLNAGGFGITYLAKNSLDREVVIKECFPGAFCRRTETGVVARSRAHQSEFATMVKLFVQEAKALSRLIHPNIVGVHEVFEEFDTAYMAIDFVDGRELLDVIEHDRASMTPPVVATTLRKLLGAVAFVHENGMLHRDISPDNILIKRDGEPILIDFGAARQQASEIGGKAMSAMRVVKDGYSPQEFYVKGSVQNESSDLYALAASFYHLITGEVPPSSQSRLVSLAESASDPYRPLVGRVEGYGDAFLAAMDRALRVLPKDRIRTARDWLDLIDVKPDLKVVPFGSRVDPLTKRSAAFGARATPGAEPGAESARPKAFSVAGKTPRSAAAAFSEILPVQEAPLSEIVVESVGGKRGALLAGAAMLVVLALGIGAWQFANPAGKGAETVVAATEPAAAPGAVQPGLVIEAAPEEAEPVVAAAPEAADAPTPEAATPAATDPQIPEPPAAAVAQATGPAEAPPATSAEPETATALAAAPAEPEQTAPAAAVTDPGVPAAAIETDERVSPRQVRLAVWQIELPFATEPTQVDNQTVPVVTSVAAPGDLAGKNAWLHEGTILFAVNGTGVSDEEAIKASLRKAAAFGEVDVLYASVRLKDTASAPFRDATLAVLSHLTVTLENDVSFRTEMIDGAWRTTVISAGAAAADGLRAGDILVSEAVTGAPMATADALEAAMAELARAKAVRAEFVVLREGAETVAKMPLATEG